MTFKFCPICGHALIPKLAGDDGNVPYCETCQRFWFPLFADCVLVLVVNEFDEIALVKMHYLSEKYVSIISGYMQPGESAEESAKREVIEELGIHLDQLDYAGTYWYRKTGSLMHGFISHTSKQSLVTSPEISEAKWVPASLAPEKMFPDSPDNAALAVYRTYLQTKQRQ